MSKKAVRTDKAPSPVGPYSQAIIYNNLVFCSGQIALDPETGQLADRDIESETSRVIENLKAVLESAGSGLDKVLKTTVFLRDMKDFVRMNEVYGSFFIGVPPARSAVQVAALPRGVRIEMECIAEI